MNVKAIESLRKVRLQQLAAAIEVARIRQSLSESDDWDAVAQAVFDSEPDLDPELDPIADEVRKVLERLKQSTGSRYSLEVSELLENFEDLEGLVAEQASWVAVYDGAVAIRERIDALRKKWGPAEFDEYGVESDVLEKLELEPRDVARRREIELAKYDAAATILGVLAELKKRFGKDYDEHDIEGDTLGLLEHSPKELTRGREREELRWALVIELKQQTGAIAKRASSWDFGDVDERLYELVGGED